MPGREVSVVTDAGKVIRVLHSGGNQSTAVTTNTPFGFIANGLYVGGAGNVTLVKPNGSTLLFSGVPAGTTLWQTCTQVNTTGTTATNIVALGD